MTAATVDTLLVGCGAVADRYYAPVLAALERGGRLRVAGLVDPDPRRLAALGAAFPRARRASDLDAALVAARPALVIVASPPAVHAAHAIAALRAGAAVFCEKPLATTRADAERMAAAATAAARPLVVGMVRRRLPAARTLRTLLAHGTLGAPTGFEAFEGGPFAWPVGPAYFAPANGGVLRDIGAHVLDLLAWWLGPLADVVAADDAMGGVEANAVVTLRAGGVPGRVRLSRDWQRPNHVTIRGARGEARWETADPARVVLTLAGAPPLVLAPAAGGATTFEEAFAGQLAALLDALAGRPAELPAAAEVAPTIGALEAASAGAVLAPSPWLGPVEAAAALVRRQAPRSTAGTVPDPAASLPTIAVVGAGGFIGSRVVEMLHLEGDAVVRPIVRRGGALASCMRFGVDGRVADARDAAALGAALAGVRDVVHCVAGDPATITESAAAVYRAAEAAGCRRLVYLSSASVHGQAPPAGTDERSPLSEHQPLAYNVAKVRAERLLGDLRARGRLELVVLRPAIVWGPRSAWIAGLADAWLAGAAHFAGRSDGVCNALYVDNLVHAIRLALAATHADGATYLLGDAEAPTWRALYGPFVAALGGRVEDLPILPLAPPPRGLAATIERMRASAPVQETLRRLPERLRRGLAAFYAAVASADAGAAAAGGGGSPSTATLETTLLHGCTTRLPWTKAATELGYRPPVDFAEGVRRTLAWLAFAGYPVRAEGSA